MWRAGAAAAPESVAALVTAFPGLPAAYLEFLRSSSGAEGDLGVHPGWIQLWPAEQVIEYNAMYGIAEHLPGFVGFASNGGGELLAFDSRVAPWRVCMVPCVPTAEEEAVQIAPDFTSLARQFGRLPPAG
ncbi:MAG TPA: SMI1/KNR4 family protein [Gemmatimonadaceae bacterium]